MDQIDSIVGTPLGNNDDTEYYLVGVDSLPFEEDYSSEYFLVKAKNTSNAREAVREKEMAYNINPRYSHFKLKINQVRCLGKLSEEQKEKVMRVKAIRKVVDGFDMPWSA